jgi:hypothetical protein
VIPVAKCPLCKGTINKKDVSLSLERLRLARSPRVLEVVDKIVSNLSTHWDIQDVDICGLLTEIQGIDDNIVIESINKFAKKSGIDKGYGIRYLSAVIKNENKSYLLRQEYERKNLDRIPPKLKD